MIYFPFGKLLHTIGAVFNKMVMRSQGGYDARAIH